MDSRSVFPRMVFRHLANAYGPRERAKELGIQEILDQVNARAIAIGLDRMGPGSSPGAGVDRGAENEDSGGLS